MPSFDGLPFEDQVFFLLALIILSLFSVGVLFAVLTVVFRARHSREERFRASLESKWDPVILEVLDGNRETADLLDLVETGEETHFLDYLLLYARRIRGEERKLLEVLAEPYLSAIVEETKSGRVDHRAWVVQTLGVLGRARHADVILESLDDPSPFVSMLAAQSLVQLGDPESPRHILERLDRYSDWHVAFLSGLLSDFGAEAGPLLRSALSDEDRPDWVRTIIAHALRNLRDLDSADIAVQVLRREEDPDLLVACLRILVDTGETRHRAALLPLLESPHFPVRSHALKALRAIGTSQDLSLFLKSLQDESPWVAMEAARGLRALGSLEQLQELARGDGPRASLAREVISE